MRRILRPLFALVILLMGSTWMLAQDPPAVSRALQRNPKLQAQQKRLDLGQQAEAALLKPYEARSPLIKRGPKGSRPARPVSVPLEKDPEILYLDFRAGKASTRERNPQETNE